jgi:hypothetical protein
LFGSSLSSAASTPYNLVSDDGSSYSNLVVQTATTTLLSGSPANIQILYEGYGISDVASGQIGPLLGIVADPEQLLNPQSIVVRFFLYLDPGNIGFTPQVDSVSIGFDEAPPIP